MQIENYNQPFLDAFSEYDDSRDLSNYDFDQDGFGPPHDDGNKRKLAFRQRVIANKYREVSIYYYVCTFLLDFFYSAVPLGTTGTFSILERERCLGCAPFCFGCS